MTALLLSMILSQPITTESPEVTLFAQWAQRQLLSVNVAQGGFEVRQRERVFRLQDDDFADAFSLVPEAHQMAVLAHDSFIIGKRFQIAGLVVSCVAPGGLILASLLMSSALLMPLLVAALATAGVGLVLALIALPFMLTAQSKFFAALASHNQGLLELRPPPVVNAGGLTLTLPSLAP